jgi:hypothetical protein
MLPWLIIASSFLQMAFFLMTARARFNGAKRALEFRASEIIEIAGVNPLRWEFKSYSPHNPALK